MRKDVTDNRKLDAQAISEVQGDTLVKNGEYSLETKEITQGGKLVAKANTFDVPYELTPEAEEKILDYIIKNMDKKDKSGKYEWLDANTVYLVDSDDLTDHLKLTYVKDDGSKVEKEMNHFYFFISFNQVNNVANPPAGAIGVDAGQHTDPTPDSPKPDEPTTPDTPKPAEPTTPDSPKPDEPTTPESPKPEEPTTPDTPKPDEPTTPDSPKPDEPTTPDSPKPAEPTTPDSPKPEEPTTPDTPKPAEPTTPDSPKPAEPTTTDTPKPEEPTEPDTPKKEKATTSTTKADQLPQTGNVTNQVAVMALGLASVVAAGAMLGLKKRRQF